MIKGNALQITDLLFGSFEEHDSNLDNAIKANPEYDEAKARINEHYEKLRKFDPKLLLDLEADHITLEVIVSTPDEF